MSANEVAAVIRGCPGVEEAVIYGVMVPGHEGRAGMAAIVAGVNFDVQTIWAHAVCHLPPYARPVFVRQCDDIALTGTFKLSTSALARQGFAGLDDPVWFAERGRGNYALLDPQATLAIDQGTTRLRQCCRRRP